MKKQVAMGLICLFLTGFSPAMAEEKAASLGEIVVTGEKLVTPTKQTSESVYTGSEVTRKGIDIQGADASVSIYEAVNILPGVVVENPDAYGLAVEQKNIRVRGVRGYLGAMTLEGVPNYGGNPMGPRDYLYDTENIESIAVYKGAVPADLGTGVGARGGGIELRARWPQEKFGASLGQSIGADRYTRTFLRLDSGSLPTVGTGLSLSYSLTEAEKWKGPGDLGPRNNVNFMAEQPLPTGDSVKLWINHNDMEQHLYKPLSYAESRRLDDTFDLDYNERLTGDRTADINFYQYNKGDYDNTDLMAVIPLSFSNAFSMNFKPYYATEDTEILNGVTAQGGLVQKRIRDITRFGLLTDARMDFSLLTVAVGYGFESMDMKIHTQNYMPGSMAFLGYGIYTENDDDGITHTPYVKLSGTLSNFDWQAGLKYFHYTDPAIRGFVTDPATRALVRAADLDREEKTYDEVLPSVGIGYRVSEAVELHANYGRNHIRPYSYVPIINIYNQNRQAFIDSGVTLNELFDGYDMEVTDSFEAGMRLRSGPVEFMPTVFYAKHKNLLSTIYDPRVDLSYQQNVGKATGYGVEFGTNLYLNKHATFFLNPTWTDLTYDKDLVYQGNVLNTEGNQVADTPEWSLKTGLIISYADFEVVPMIRWLDKRYGDAENTEKVDDYIVADLKIAWTKKAFSFVKALKVSLELSNLFDEKYISVVSASDDTRAGSATYYAGAPSTALMTVGFDF